MSLEWGVLISFLVGVLAGYRFGWLERGVEVAALRGSYQVADAVVKLCLDLLRKDLPPSTWPTVALPAGVTVKCNRCGFATSQPMKRGTELLCHACWLKHQNEADDGTAGKP